MVFLNSIVLVPHNSRTSLPLSFVEALNACLHRTARGQVHANHRSAISLNGKR